jgi:aspartate aminotransferase
MARRYDGFPDVQLNLNVRGVPRSATLAINERCAAMQSEGRSVFRLGLGQSPFPVPEPVVEALRANAHQKDYLPVQGLRLLRETIARQHREEHGVDCDADDVLIGPGSKELMFLLQVVYYGDLVIPTPAWVSYAPQARILGHHVHFLATRREDGWKLVPDQLEILCALDPGRPRIVILNYPSNPTGGTYSEDELEELARVASHQRVVLLSDEIYGRLHHDGNHRSIVPLYPQGTIFSGGLSKWCGAGGWRLGVFIVPHAMRWLLDAMAAVASETFTSTSAPIQYAAVRAFEGGPEIDAYLSDCQRILKALGASLACRLRQADLDVLEPEGGFYLLPDFTPVADRLRHAGISTSTELCDRLLANTGVAILPGSDFGRPPGELVARVAYVNFNGGGALAAVAAGEIVDNGFLDRHCHPTLESIDRLCQWIEDLGR